MATKIEIVSLPKRTSGDQSEVSVTLPSGNGWTAVGAVPFADAQGAAAAVVFDNASAGGQIVFSKGILAEDTSTGVTAGLTETPYTNQVTIPAGTLQAGDRIRVRAKVKQLTQNGADTIALALALAANSAGLAASTANLSTVAAVSAASGVTWQLEFDGRWSAVGAATAATLTGSGSSWKNGATPAFLGTDVDDNTTVGTNVDIACGVTYTYSASSAGNTSRLKELYVEVIRPQA